MLNFCVKRDESTGEYYIETPITGKSLLTLPQLNKSTAFTIEERHTFGLLGKLPDRVETLDEQVLRTYVQFSNYNTPLQQNIYLNNLHDKNQILFYKLTSRHLSEMLPIIYTPTVGEAVKQFSHQYRQPRGLYISHKDIDHIEEILENRSNPNVEIIVVTDGEGVLGIGDQGIGGMDIPVAKLMVYSLCGGINPTGTLPVFLDVGTNNQELLNNPMYLGCKHPRIPQDQYDAFIEAFIKAVKKTFPDVFLHWEDFGRGNARRLLDRYQKSLCSFNDDIQGTGAVTLAALMAACNVTGTSLADQRFVVFGAGSAGTGISDQIVDALIKQGLSEKEAFKRFWLVDRQGLLCKSDNNLTLSQKPYARKDSEVNDWSWSKMYNYPTLRDTVFNVKPTVLIGCSAQPGSFSQDIVEIMAANCPRPIIFPLSNPDEKCEASPENLIYWTHGQALVATGTLFPTVQYQNRLLQIAQCNNALVFPGIGLGILAVKATHLSKSMILAAAEALSEFSPTQEDSFLPLLPELEKAQEVAKYIAVKVAEQAIAEGFAQCNQEKDLHKLVNAMFWEPRYLPFRKKI